MNRVRIARLGGVVSLAALVVWVHLYGLMGSEHELWLERSYLNRWAFRDVPTRRGTLSDRNGVWIARDRPGFDLALRYQTFRRRHPLGIVVHGANLLRAAQGAATPVGAKEPVQFRSEAGIYLAAMHELLAVPLRQLRRGQPETWPGAAVLLRYAERPEDVSRDLMFYAGALAAALAEESQRGYAVDLSRAVADPGEGTVLDALQPRLARALDLATEATDPAAAGDPTLRAQLLDALAGRLRRAFDEVAALDARLVRAADGGLVTERAGADLWSELERRRVDALAWRTSQALSEDEQLALEDPDFWRDLAQSGVLVEDFETFWTHFDAASRGRAVAGWSARRDVLLGALERRKGELAARRAQLELMFQRRLGSAAELTRAQRDIEREWNALQQRIESDVLIVPVPGERTPILRDEGRARLLRSRLPYEFAAWLGMLEERLPGFEVQPSVLREQNLLPGRADLGGMAVHLGRVTPYYRTDYVLGSGLTPERSAADVFDALQSSGSLDLQDPDLPPELEESVQRGAHSTLRRHYRIFGRVGRSGVERALDDVLRGQPGLRLVERDRRAREQQMFRRFDVRPGQDVQLTFDMRLQALADEVVQVLAPARERALVVLDAQSGDVLAMSGRSDLPLRGGEPVGVEGRFAATPLVPTGTAWIGSVFKPFVSLAYLERLARQRDLVSPRRFAPCRQNYEVGDRVFKCDGHHGELSGDVAASLTRSCNVFFFEARKHAGASLVDDALSLAGWETGASELGEARLQDVVPGVPRLLRGRLRGGALSSYVQAIGYGVEASTLFVARAYAGLATGSLPDVGLVAGPRSGPEPIPVARTHLETVRRGLHGCVAESRGTGRFITSALQEMGVLDIAYGKSGTARIAEPVPNGRGALTNTWFALFLGTDAEASLVLVATAYVVEASHGGGGAIAAPMTAEFLRGLRADPKLWRQYVEGKRR